MYNIHSPLGLKLLTRLRLGLSHLREHKFKYNFQDCIDPFCICSIETESTEQFFLHCHNYVDLRVILLNDIRTIDHGILNTSDDDLVYLLLYGHQRYSFYENQMLIQASINFIIKSERFNGPLFYIYRFVFYISFTDNKRYGVDYVLAFCCVFFTLLL